MGGVCGRGGRGNLCAAPPRGLHRAGRAGRDAAASRDGTCRDRVFDLRSPRPRARAPRRRIPTHVRGHHGGLGRGDGATWDRPQPHARTIEVGGAVLHGVYDLVATLERLLHADLRALLGDADPIPAGSTVLGDPAAIALHDAVVEPGVVFDVRGGPVVLES